MTQLLVSVRSAAEAEIALRGGAALIDVKEPARGSLGRAKDTLIAEVVRGVANRRPVSAALGELVDDEAVELPPVELSLAYVKWGLAGYGGAENAWRRKLHILIGQLQKYWSSCRVVAVAYADWRQAGAPKPEEVCAFAVDHKIGALLLDTWKKDGSTLLDWLTLPQIERWRERCRLAKVPIALAGSLGPAEIRALLPLQPDWIAVRGAVCQGRRRQATLDEGKVRHLAALISGCPSISHVSQKHC